MLKNLNEIRKRLISLNLVMHDYRMIEIKRGKVRVFDVINIVEKDVQELRTQVDELINEVKG